MASYGLAMAQSGNDDLRNKAARALDSGDFPSVVEMTQSTVDNLLLKGSPDASEAEVLYLHATALLSLEAHLQPLGWKRCQECLETALKSTLDATSRVCCLIQLAGLWFVRPDGDVRWNHTRATKLGLEALDNASATGDPALGTAA